MHLQLDVLPDNDARGEIMANHSFTDTNAGERSLDEDHIAEVQRAGELRKFFERMPKENVG